MGFYDAIRIGASGAVDSAYTVDRSLRFNDDDNAYLNRTPSSAGNRKVWTWSAWVKRANLGLNTATLFHAYDGSSSNRGVINFQSDDTLNIDQGGGSGSSKGQAESVMKFRDPSAWYHIVIRANYSDSTASDRIKLYVNGIQQTLTFDVAFVDEDGQINGTFEHQIGQHGSSNYFDGYMAEINFIDGQAYDPSYFGETDAITGQWNPKEYTGSYGNQGFYLKFADNSGTTATTLGKDSSGNGNNFTPNNFATNDAVKDSPTNNFCTMNILDDNFSSPKFTYSEGNLKYTYSYSGSGFDRVFGSHFITAGDTNKYYMEFTGNVTNEQMQWGVVALDSTSYTPADRTIGISGNDLMNMLRWASYTAAPYLRRVDGNGDNALTTSNGNAANGDIFSLVYDAGNGKLFAFLNGVEVGGQTYASGTSVWKQLDTTKTYAVCMHQGDGGVSTKAGNMTANFGQDSSFAGAKTAQGNTDANGIGDFYYSVPSGAKALCSANLPDPTILLPNKHFGTITYSGNGSANRTISDTSLVNFSPDWVWVKRRDSNGYHILTDAIRGAGKYLVSNTTDAESSGGSQLINGFVTNGFQIGTENAVNSSSGTYVAWNWNAGDTDGKTYTVKVVSDGGNKYRFDDFGTSAVTLDLAEGGTYIFDGSDSSMASHPIKLSETSNGTHGGGSSYNTGVTYLLDGASVTESAYVSGYSSATTRQLKIVVAASAPTLYYYCHYHSGMGGQANTNSTLGSSNFDGTIQSVAKVNASAGFSIVTYSGNHTSGATVGHGLGIAPKVVIVKARGTVNNQNRGWNVYHAEIGNTKYIQLNSENTPVTNSDWWNNTSPNSTTFTLGNDYDVNADISGGNYVVYCFSEVAGYSKFGSYTGNGSSDGPFVFTGFRPAMVIIKCISNTEQWYIIDNKRPEFNGALGSSGIMKWLKPNQSSAENQNGLYNFLSNGFKLGYPGVDTNGNGRTYIYLAFAESPFKNARAR